MRTPEVEVAAFNHLSPQQIAKRLNCSAKKAKALIRSGKLPAINIGTELKPMYRVDPRVFEQYLESAVVELAS